MNLALAATAFSCALRAQVQTAHGIFRQLSALGTHLIFPMMPPAVKRNHLRHNILFTFNTIHPLHVSAKVIIVYRLTKKILRIPLQKYEDVKPFRHPRFHQWLSIYRDTSGYIDSHH